MGLNDFLDRFRQAPTPEPEPRKTTMQLLDDEKFLAFLEKVEEQSGRRVFAGLSLDAPASDEMVEYHRRYLDQKRVADQVTSGVKQEFKEAGLAFDANLLLPSSTPYQDRYDAFFVSSPPNVTHLPQDVADAFERVKFDATPEASGNHRAGVEGEDAAAAGLLEKSGEALAMLRNAQADMALLRQTAGLSPLVLSDPADPAKVSTELQKASDALGAFVGNPTLTGEVKDLVVEYRLKLKKVVDDAKAALSDPPDAALTENITKLIDAETATTEADLGTKREALENFEADVAEKLLAKETMGSRLDAIRAEVAEQAIANPMAFDLLKERMARLEVKDKEVQALRQQIEQNGLSEPGSVRDLHDMRRSLKVVNRYGSDQPLLGKIRRLISPTYRRAANQLEQQFKFSAETDRQSIKDQLAHVESLLQAPTGFQQALQEAEMISTGIKADIPTLQGFGGAVRVALQESLKAKLAKGDLAGVTKARGQVENMRFATLINEGVDIEMMKGEIEATSREVFKKNLFEQLDAKGGKNIGTILRGFESLATKLQSSKSIESQNLLDFVKECLDEVISNETYEPRTRRYAELIRNTVEARYA